MTLAELAEYLPALPEAILLVGACVLLLGDARSTDESRRASLWAAQGILLLCALATVFVMWAGGPGRFYLFNKLFVADFMASLLKLACYLSVSAVLVYSRQYLADRRLLRGEFATLMLFSLLGMMIMISANSFLTLYLGLELMSLCLYALVALDRDSPLATEAAMKYFVLGALSSGILLYGMSMIYGGTGTLTLTEVARESARLSASTADRSFLVFGVVFVVAGLAFKVGVVPFHMWLPDVYHGAPTPVTLFISAGPKIAAFAMAIRLLVNGLPALAADWQQMLALLALLSIALGNITAIAQTNLKRMLAYSAIAHMGFMLLGLMSGYVGGNSLNRNDAYSAALFYMLVYTIMTLGSFGMLLYLSRAGFDCEKLEDMRGLNKRSPWTAFLMMIVMFSLAGIPPTAGFYAKLAVFSAAVSAGHLWIAVVAVLLSLIGAYYYLRIVKLMYFDEPADSPVAGDPDATLINLGVGQRGMRWMLSANALLLLVLGILPAPLMAVCFAAIVTL
jgi:NADH-quinone oxidoreductase subunit N